MFHLVLCFKIIFYTFYRRLYQPPSLRLRTPSQDRKPEPETSTFIEPKDVQEEADVDQKKMPTEPTSAVSKTKEAVS